MGELYEKRSMPDFCKDPLGLLGFKRALAFYSKKFFIHETHIEPDGKVVQARMRVPKLV